MIGENAAAHLLSAQFFKISASSSLNVHVVHNYWIQSWAPGNPLSERSRSESQRAEGSCCAEFFSHFLLLQSKKGHIWKVLIAFLTFCKHRVKKTKHLATVKKETGAAQTFYMGGRRHWKGGKWEQHRRR